MLFSVNYQSEHKLLADEIKCPYNKLGYIYDFMKTHPEKRYNICLSNELPEKAKEQIDIVKNMGLDFTIECGDVAILSILLAGEYPAYLRFPITDWEGFSALRDLGVTDIYIDGPLCFQIDKIALGKGNVNIRTSPTISPSCSLSKRTPDTFFLRPEDIYLVKNSIDIIDFNEKNQTREDALFTMYKRGVAPYRIADIINGFTPYRDIYNSFIDHDFATQRLNCGQKCKQPNSMCHYCDRYFNVLSSANKLAELAKENS